MAIALIAVAAALIAAYLAVRFTRPQVQTLRADMPGHLVALSQGLTHAQWHGAESGPKALSGALP